MSELPDIDIQDITARRADVFGDQYFGTTSCCCYNSNLISCNVYGDVYVLRYHSTNYSFRLGILMAGEQSIRYITTGRGQSTPYMSDRNGHNHIQTGSSPSSYMLLVRERIVAYDMILVTSNDNYNLYRNSSNEYFLWYKGSSISLGVFATTPSYTLFNNYIALNGQLYFQLTPVAILPSSSYTIRSDYQYAAVYTSGSGVYNTDLYYQGQLFDTIQIPVVSQYTPRFTFYDNNLLVGRSHNTTGAVIHTVIYRGTNVLVDIDSLPSNQTLRLCGNGRDSSQLMYSIITSTSPPTFQTFDNTGSFIFSMPISYTQSPASIYVFDDYLCGYIPPSIGTYCTYFVYHFTDGLVFNQSINESSQYYQINVTSDGYVFAKVYNDGTRNHLAIFVNGVQTADIRSDVQYTKQVLQVCRSGVTASTGGIGNAQSPSTAVFLGLDGSVIHTYTPYTDQATVGNRTSLQAHCCRDISLRDTGIYNNDTGQLIGTRLYLSLGLTLFFCCGRWMYAYAGGTGGTQPEWLFFLADRTGLLINAPSSAEAIARYSGCCDNGNRLLVTDRLSPNDSYNLLRVFDNFLGEMRFSYIDWSRLDG